MLSFLKKVDDVSETICKPATSLIQFGILEFMKHPVLTPIAAASGFMVVKEVCDRLDRRQSELNQAEIAQYITEVGIIKNTVECNSSEEK
ncbi:hypothetical protein H7097_02340 [Aeromicrobium sp.]|nr:hypothetical protein [Candidatus Saccharibacteria bacterium]